MCLDLISLLKLITASPIKKYLKTEVPNPVSRNKPLQEQIHSAPQASDIKIRLPRMQRRLLSQKLTCLHWTLTPTDHRLVILPAQHVWVTAELTSSLYAVSATKGYRKQATGFGKAISKVVLFKKN